jgi:hypothetical protein
MKPQWTACQPQQTKAIKEYNEDKKAEVEEIRKETNWMPTVAQIQKIIMLVTVPIVIQRLKANPCWKQLQRHLIKRQRQFSSSKGLTCWCFLKLNHCAKDCRERIAKGHAIPVADIEAGLYNKDHASTNTNQEEAFNLKQDQYRPVSRLL